MNRILSWRRTAVAGAVVVVVALPAGALLGLRARPDSSIAAVTFDAAAVVAAPVPRDITDEKAVKVLPTWAPGVSLLAPAWSGLVTSVSAKAGERS